MGGNLTGDEARIWGLHVQACPVSRIAGLVGLSDGYVREVIARAWRDDKANAKASEKGA